MQVSLEAIKFNHDPNSAISDALNIRRNETEAVTVPEWRKGVSALPDDSPAAYAICAIGRRQITIKAKFKCLDPKIKSVEVRAIDPARNLEATCATTGNILGEVANRRVTFDSNGETKFEGFELVNVDIQNRGISSSVTTFIWQCRLRATDTWSFLQTTRHRIYTILDLPEYAWRQEPFDGRNPQLLWTEVLDYACEWAAGATELDEAAARITQAVNDLGKSLVAYDGPSSYADLTFDCGSLLSLFRDDKGLGQRINCSDCATIVSTFANAVGCDLWQSRMGSDFTTNPIRLIGAPVFKPADFVFHEVAWKDDCSFDDELFDACLELDGDDDPGSSPQTPVLAVQTEFGTTQVGDYRFRLALPPKDCLPDPCHPTPEERRRRLIGLNTQPPDESLTESELDENATTTLDPQIFSGTQIIASWELYRVRLLKRRNLIFGAYSLWFLPDGDPEELIRLDVYEFGSPQAAVRERERLIDRYEVRDVKQANEPTVSAMDFVNVSSTAIIGHLGVWVVEVRSVGRKEIDIRPFWRALSEMIS